MPRGTCVLFAGALALLAGAGCDTLDSFSLNYLGSTAAGRERVVSGSVAGVSRSVEGVLHTMGLEARSHKDGETMRVHSQTSAGETFVVVVSQTDDGRARVRVEWQGVADDQLGAALLAQLDFLRAG